MKLHLVQRLVQEEIAIENIQSMTHLNLEFGKRDFSAEEYHTVYGITMKFEEAYLIGRIDRLY